MSKKSKRLGGGAGVAIKSNAPIAQLSSIPSPLSLPQQFLDMLDSAVGQEIASRIVTAIQESPPVISIRINPAKWPNLVAAGHPLVNNNESLSGEKNTNIVAWCPAGLYLTERPNFTLDPAFHAGAYYVQEPSSMIIEILRPIVSEASNVLDLCAAPGGKSTHLATMLRGGAAAGGETAAAFGRPASGRPAARLTANEIIRSRAATLRENISKWGDPRVTVTSLDPSAFANRGEIFDFILVDAPCSGEGMFRKDPEAISEWSPRAVDECVTRQRKIVMDIWATLEPGGYLAYSTCTMNLHENEENVDWFAQNMGAQIIPLTSYLKSHDQGIIITSQGSLRLHPGLVKGEGLFLALLRKPEDQFVDSEVQNIKSKFQFKTSKSNPTSTKADSSKTSIPDHYEAMSFEYNNQYPSVELSRKLAIKFLSRETLSLPDSPMGYLRVTYCGLGLGFVKNIGSRANNLLPTSLRILRPGI